MSNLPSSDSSIDGHGKDNRGYQILLQLLRGEAGQGNAFMARGDIDTYKGLVQLRELLRGGQITPDEYEAAKTELLFNR